MKDKIKEIIKNKIIKITAIINSLLEKIIEKDVKKLIKDLVNYKKTDWLIFFISIPFSFIFIICNIISFLLFLVFFILNFIFNKIKIKNTKNNKKIIKYKKRFKFLKNFYIIILEKVLITFPKKKAFLVFYIFLKKIYKNDTEGLEIKFIKEKLKAISNRYVISFFIGIPFIVLSCSNELVKIISDLNSLNYTSRKAYINTIILNCYKNLIPEYAKLVEKLKIIINKKKIDFNSLKEIMKAAKYTNEFKDGFGILKKKLKIGSAYQKISENELTEKHPTVILNTNKNNNEEKISLYINESTKPEIKIKRFNEEIQKYIDEKVNNSLKHKGSINKKIETFYTPPIKTLTKNIVLEDPFKDKFLKNSVKEENINNIIAGLTVSLKENLIETKKIKTEITINNQIIEKEENKLIKEKTEKAFLNWIKENKNKFDDETFEAIMKINNFWEENAAIIIEMSQENKIKLSKMINLDIEDMDNPKEINFKIFISFLTEKK